MTTVSVTVTPDHIARGKPGDCAACPITLAILDAIPAATHVEVWWADTCFYATAWLPRGTLAHRLGEDAYEFIRAFDDAGTAEPFTFTMTIPDGAS